VVKRRCHKTALLKQRNQAKFTHNFHPNYPLLPRLRLRRFWEDFGKRLFEPNDFIGEFPLAVSKSTQSQETSGRGCSFLWLLPFEQAKESNSPRGEKG